MSTARTVVFPPLPPVGTPRPEPGPGVGRIDYGRGDPHELHLMGLWDGLGERLGFCTEMVEVLQEYGAQGLFWVFLKGDFFGMNVF